jgi:hypothetical protein
LTSDILNGDPLMKLAELPVPQSAWLAMWPPHERMTGVVTAGTVKAT